MNKENKLGMGLGALLSTTSNKNENNNNVQKNDRLTVRFLNESDEPKFTQPNLYNLISKHPSPRDVYFKRITESNNEIDKDLSIKLNKEFKQMLQERLDEVKQKPLPYKPQKKDEEWSFLKLSEPKDFIDSPETKINLKDFKLTFRSKYRAADIEIKKNSIVPGGLFEISKSDEKKLDVYEDYPILYKKYYFYYYGKKVMTYTMVKKSPFKFPTERYLNVVKRGYKDCKLDKKYLKNALKI